MKKRTCANSSLILSVSYDEKNKILEVEFRKGGKYNYHAVPRQLFEELEIVLDDGEESIGKWFIRRIKNVYKAEKV